MVRLHTILGDANPTVKVHQTFIYWQIRMWICNFHRQSKKSKDCILFSLETQFLHKKRTKIYGGEISAAK